MDDLVTCVHAGKHRIKRNRLEWTWPHCMAWFASQCEQIEDLLTAALTPGKEGWTWKEGANEDSGRMFWYREKIITYTMGKTEITFDIQAFGRGYPARSVSITINGWSFNHQCDAGEKNYAANVRRIVQIAMLILISTFTHGDNQRFFPNLSELDKMIDNVVT